MTASDQRPRASGSPPVPVPVAWSLVALGLVSALSALVGLPLYGDGTLYYFRLVLDGAPEIPNLRLAAVLPQLPALGARWLTDDPTLLRHVFSLGYAALPALSLIACWLVVRRKAPALILFPALFLVANQVNLSGVSELLTSLYFTWPFVLLAALHPDRRLTWAYGAALGPLLLLLHPLDFLLLATLAGLAGLNARRHARTKPIWLGLAAAFAITGGLRLLWTLLWGNAYERSHGGSSKAAYYLIPDTPTQALLLLLVLTLALALAWALGCPQREGGQRLRRGMGLGFLMLPPLATAIGAGLLVGAGIKLKVGAIFPLSLLLMGLAATLGASWRHHATTPALAGRRALPWRNWLALCALAITLTTTARSAAWWTATRGLMNATASSEGDCIPWGPEEPYDLQWPWMAIVDNWTAPMSALIFRGPWPIPLLLPRDGCTVLRETGIAHLHPWILYPVPLLEARFGPLRPAAPRPRDSATSGLDAHPETQQPQAVEGQGEDEDQDDAEGQPQGDVAHPVESVAKAVHHVEDRVRQ